MLFRYSFHTTLLVSCSNLIAQSLLRVSQAPLIDLHLLAPDWASPNSHWFLSDLRGDPFDTNAGFINLETDLLMKGWGKPAYTKET
ncbi:MAG: hypothetical protein KDC80_12340 [Saprospiraceae bacterium]|nr:hypothetical protein [Saprospiraceae bacterium]